MREQLGNHIFLGSGLLRTFDQLEQDQIGVPVLPHGIHSQLRQVRARRTALRQADDGKQTAGSSQIPVERQPSRSG